MNERFILGSKINDVSFDQALKIARTFLVSDKTNYIVTPNPEICLIGYRDANLREIIKQANLAIPDGFGLKIGAKILRQRLDNRITGVDMSMALFDIAEQNNHSILLIGGKGKTGTKAIEALKKIHPNLKVDYLNGGIFDDNGNSEFPDFINKINAIKPDLLLINLGAPKQEYFIKNFKDKLNCQLLMGVGGTIDFLSGKVKRAPKIISKLGIEWLYRFIKQPWRWKRIFNAVILFPLTCLIWRIRNTFIYRNGVVGFIINTDKKILIAKRKPRPGDKDLNDHWQLPQGGVDKDEPLETAVRREMLEEIGLAELQILAQKVNCYKYTWGFNAKRYYPFKGQKQSLFLLKHNGDNNEVKVDNKEFTDYKWVEKHHILQLAHPYRRSIIKIGLQAFKDYL